LRKEFLIQELKQIDNVKVFGLEDSVRAAKFPMAVDVEKTTSEITDRTYSLFSVPTGTGHDNALKGIVVQFDLTMTPKMSVELERYHFIDFVSSQSTMHRITNFDLDKAYIEYVDPRVVEIMKEKVQQYNKEEDPTSRRAKQLYLEILYTNPCGIYLTARMTTNYQQLKTIYLQRRNHRLPEWKTFCDWIETLPHFMDFCIKKRT
jgi:hypothetical protein